MKNTFLNTSHEQKTLDLSDLIDKLKRDITLLQKQVDDKNLLIKNLNEQKKGKELEYEITMDKIKFENTNLKNKIESLERRVLGLNKTKVEDSEMFKQIQQLK